MSPSRFCPTRLDRSVSKALSPKHCLSSDRADRARRRRVRRIMDQSISSLLCRMLLWLVNPILAPSYQRSRAPVAVLSTTARARSATVSRYRRTSELFCPIYPGRKTKYSNSLELQCAPPMIRRARSGRATRRIHTRIRTAFHCVFAPTASRPCKSWLKRATGCRSNWTSVARLPGVGLCGAQDVL